MSATPNTLPDRSTTNDTIGIYRLARKDLPTLREAASELKQAFLNVDLHQARNVPGFIKALSRDLAFPEWFGGNLDALHDCLTDLSWLPAPGYVITLDGSESLQANATSFAALNAVLSSAAEEWLARSIPFKIFYLEDEATPPSGQNSRADAS